MSNDEPVKLDVTPLIEGYVDRARRELAARIEAWPPTVTFLQTQEVIGGLLARQVTLATQLAQAPSIWNGHIAPIILRSMADVYITFAWMWGDVEKRCAMYVSYGLGQLKLQLEHLKAHVAAQGRDSTTDPLIKTFQERLDAERINAFIEVNIGNWSGTDTRSMAVEADCLDLYRFAYSPFSRATHSMWPHISQYNLKPCINPLHRMHRVPTDEEWPLDVDYLYRAAKYVDKTMRLFDAKVARDPSTESSFRWLAHELTTPESEPEDELFQASQVADATSESKDK